MRELERENATLQHTVRCLRQLLSDDVRPPGGPIDSTPDYRMQISDMFDQASWVSSALYLEKPTSAQIYT